MKCLTCKMIMEAVQVSLGAVYKNEFRLITQHCHELNIVGAFYHYFREMFEWRFDPYCIDMEYSRMGTRMMSKEINANAGAFVCPFCNKEHNRRIRSDFIVHKPGEDDNLLVIEFKGAWSSGCLYWDEKKLRELTKPLISRPKGESYVCGYKLGVSIIMKEGGCESQMFVRGDMVGSRIPISKKCLIDKHDAYLGNINTEDCE